MVCFIQVKSMFQAYVGLEALLVAGAVSAVRTLECRSFATAFEFDMPHEMGLALVTPVAVQAEVFLIWNRMEKLTTSQRRWVLSLNEF